MIVSQSSGIQVGDNNTQFNAYTSVVPSVAAQELGLWWSGTWLPFTDPPLTGDMVLAGRQEAATALRAALDGDKTVLAVEGDLSTMEMKAFLAASLAPSPLGERTVFVSDPAALATILAGTEPRILALATGTAPPGLPLTGSHKILLYGRLAVHPMVTVPAVDGDAVAEILVRTGMEPGRARELGTRARRGLEQLRRALTRHPEYSEAAWAAAPDQACRRLSLLGGFTAGDRDLVAGFAGLPYAELMDAARRLAADPDTPLLGHLGDRWYVQAAEDAFVLLRASLTTEDLTAFAELTARVLGPAGEGSAALRRGIAESLVLLAVHGGKLRYGSSGHLATDLVRSIVRDLLTGTSSAVWTSLTDVLELLAEAAPGEFLAGLSRSPEWHARMFDSERTYPAFLWALELLARPTEHFDDAVGALARLAAVDPGGTLSNRPATSLVEIFDCRFPQTRAARAARLRALRRLLRTEPDVTRTLLIELLPHGSVIRTVHPGPRFRDWPAPEGPSPDDVYQGFRDVASLAIDDAGTDPERCLRLISKIDAMPSEERAAFTQVLANLTVDDDVLRRRLFDALHELVARHREFEDEAWALPPGEVAALDRVAGSFTPRRAVDRHRWMFADRWPRRGLNRHWDVELARWRAEAVREILGDEGLDALVALATETSTADLVGAALPRQTDEGLLMSWLAGEQPALAFAYFAARIREEGHAKRTELLGRAGDSARRAAILLAARDPRWAWAELATLDPETSDAYWRGFPTSGLGQEFNSIAEAAAGLNSVRRFAAALDLIAIYSGQTDSADIATQTVIGCEGFTKTRETDPEAHLVSKYELQAAIDILGRHGEAIGLPRVTAVELTFSSRLGPDAELPTTSARLTADPAFFTELIRTRCRAEAAETRNAAFRALNAWDRCPGTGADGMVDFQVLHTWVGRARELLSASGLLQVGDRTIGGVLAFALPSSPDAVGELLEEVRSDKLDQGLRIGLYNSRGLTWRTLTDGGVQERRLAGEYWELARRAEGFPRAQRILRDLAETYEREARQEDDEAEGVRRGI